MKRIKKILISITFAVYLAALLYILFLSRYRFFMNTDGVDYAESIRRNINLMPFHMIMDFIRYGSLSSTFSNIFGNLVLFAPMGIFLPVLFIRQRKMISFALTMFFILLLVEGVQLFTLLGVFDIDDIILNLAGTFGGYGIYKVKYGDCVLLL